ncbi:MAG TPA: UbiD family decarboxylase [Bacteroidia bacterium]|nr:UbiD family decarboxylase [Bacteroidia bacterium]
MNYQSLESAILDLEKNGYLIRIKEEVDPNLEMASIHLRVHQNGGPAILFENVKGSPFRAVSNLFGTIERSRFIFRKTLKVVNNLVNLKNNPTEILKNPFKLLGMIPGAITALPKKSSHSPVQFSCTNINNLPLIKHWPDDGGAFVTLPQVYTEDIDFPGVAKSNLGMYRIQLTGNAYELNKEIGLHYQLHRGIGVHQSKSDAQNRPLKVSIFIGGPPAHSFAAVMPLPEGLSELNFAGALAGKRFSYSYDENQNFISNDADFVITGEVMPGAVKPEGPFGDHLGYYSLKHLFPVMKVHKVYHKKNAIWAFTVVGRPPQEDTAFGKLIHEITGPVVPSSIPGLHDVHAVDAAGVHPLLLAIGSERYTPYIQDRKPQEILTIANHILGFGQMSLAKYLFIVAKEDNPKINIHQVEAYFTHVFERVDWSRDLHFQTNTTIDTLDYSGESINSGSKVVIAAAGKIKRLLIKSVPTDLHLPLNFTKINLAMPGVLCISTEPFIDYSQTAIIIDLLDKTLQSQDLTGVALIVLCDNSDFCSKNINNFVWTVFTKSNPSHDIYGIESFTRFKHWGCNGPLIIDARKKPFHAPDLILDQKTEKRVDELFTKGHSLFGLG